MKLNLWIVLLVIWLASTAHAQGFTCFISETDQVLPTTCGGNDPLPDGTLVQIMWDRDANGPSGSDSLPPFCFDCTPECHPTDVNRNTFDWGQFVEFSSCGAMPNPPRYWLKICAGGIQWWSAVAVMASGPNEWETDGWVCLNTPCLGCRPPQAPANFAATNGACGGVTLTWIYPDTVVSVDSFFVYRDGAFLSRVARTNGTGGVFTYLDATGVPGQNYTYGAEARWAYECYLRSVRVNASGMRASIVPIAPPQLVAHVQGNDIVLHWEPVTQSIGGCNVMVTRYFIYSSTTLNGQYNLIGLTRTETTFVHAGVIPTSPMMFYRVTTTTDLIPGPD